VSDWQGLSATAEDSLIVGATAIPKLQFVFKKNIPPEEGGIGVLHEDKLSCTFKNVNAQPGDRIIFLYNRNQFGRLNASDQADDADLVLKTNNTFSGAARLAKRVTLNAVGGNLCIVVSGARFDRTGDPRFNRAELRGVFQHQRIAVCIVPAAGTPRVFAYLGNIEVQVKGGSPNHLIFIPEQSVAGKATLKQPDPKKQEVY